jgi:uncharacterized protein YjiS (DUF1127 family)
MTGAAFGMPAPAITRIYLPKKPATATRPAAQQPRSELMALAMRSSAANGFGDAATAVPELAASRARAWRERIERRLAALRANFRAEAQRRALARLSPATLRDLGLDRSEVGSLTAELNGTAEATRRWTERAQAGSAAGRLRIISVDSFL